MFDVVFMKIKILTYCEILRIRESVKLVSGSYVEHRLDHFCVSETIIHVFSHFTISFRWEKIIYSVSAYINLVWQHNKWSRVGRGDGFDRFLNYDEEPE